jgi:hypothetical protein
MVKRGAQFGFMLLAVALALIPGSNALAQRRLPNDGPRPRIEVERPPAIDRQTTPQERKMLDLPPGWIARVQQMTPAQQEKFLNNNARFRSLPPERQAQIRQNLQAWNNLTPEQKQAFLDRDRVWQQMTPEQQRYVRETLLPEWQALPPKRRQVLQRKLHDLRDLDDSQRAEKLNDERFLNGLDPNERQVLRDLANLRINGPEPPE